MRKLGIIAGLLIAALSCRFAYADTSDEYANIKTVGVISRIGDALTLKRVGLTVFANTEAALPITDWGVDEMVSSLVTSALAPRFTIKPVDTTALQSTADIKSFIQGLPRESVADAYIVISKTQIQDPTNFTSAYLSGLGLYRHDMLFSGPLNTMYALYLVSVIDAKTGKLIDYGRSRLDDGGLFNFVAPNIPNDAANWADTPDAMTDTQKQAVKVQMLQLIQRSLPYALKNAKPDIDTTDQIGANEETHRSHSVGLYSRGDRRLRPHFLYTIRTKGYRCSGVGRDTISCYYISNSAVRMSPTLAASLSDHLWALPSLFGVGSFRPSVIHILVGTRQ